MLAFLVVLWTALALPARAGEDEGYRMNDLGGTVTLPPGWRSRKWADWELEAESGDGILSKIWFTPWQVEVTDEALAAWTERQRRRLERDKLADVRVAETRIEEIAGRPTGVARITFRIRNRIPGVAWYVAFTGAGKVVHARVVTQARRSREAWRQLRWILEHLELDSGPLDAGGPRVEVEGSFAATLPDGWRPPVRPEMDGVRKVTAKVGQEGLAGCWVAIRPPIEGDPDVLFACPMPLYVGPLDEYSWEGVEAEVHAALFGNAAAEVPRGQLVDVGDRKGLLFRPPVAAMATRLAVAPYDGGLLTLWGIGNHLDENGVEQAITAVLPTVGFLGPDGGRPIVSADRWVAYYLKYRPTSPVVLGPALALVGLVAGGVFLARRRSAPRFEEL